MWHHTENREEKPEPGKWEKVIATIHADFRGGELAAPCAWQMVAMIPKGGVTEFRGIGLVEILWKAISGIIHRWLLYSIQFHGVPHGFCVGIGMGTATLKSNLLQNIIAIR